MKATQLLHNMGQSIWLDNITRKLLTSGTLRSYIDELSVTGLTSNPTIFDQAIKSSTDYDTSIREKLARGKSGEDLFFELAIEDITKALDQVVALVKGKKDGLRAEQIRAALKMQSKEMPRVLQEGLAKKKLKTKGQKRATTYFAVG